MLLFVLYPVFTSSTEGCRGSCSQSFIGLMCRKEFSINSSSQCRAACTAKHHGTSQTPVYQCEMFQHGTSSIRYSAFFDGPRLRDAGSEHSVHGPSLWLARILWNSLTDNLRDPDLGRHSFRHLLKTHLFKL